MGNKLCKKKVDVVDNSQDNTTKKNPKSIDRIIKRLHLRPTSWKSDSHLNQKQVNRSGNNPKSENIIRTQPLSKSSDWTEASLEVPEKEEHVHLRNPKLSIIFNNENGTPTPPPRKQKKNFREKIEAVAKNGLQAFQTKKPIEEPLFVKKKINYDCPVCDGDEKNHNRDHHHNHKNKTEQQKKLEKNNSLSEKKVSKKRKKNLSVVSLPNYNELKFTVANFEDIDKPKLTASSLSLQNNSKKLSLTSSTGKLDNYITRCRSFGSLLPQQLRKLKTQKAPADIESDDSFGGLEDWDLGLIEHYNPKDASLPRPRKIPKSNKDVLSGIEGLVVTEEEIEKQKPVPPVRRSESLVKKINKEASEKAQKLSSSRVEQSCTRGVDSSVNLTPPPSPVSKKKEETAFPLDLPTEEDGKVEHSSLMKILQEFSMKKASLDEENLPVIEDKVEGSKTNSNFSSLTPSLLEFEKNLNVNSIEEFIIAEKVNTDVNLSKFNNAVVS